MLEMEIDSIRVSLANYQRVVILKERQSDRYLPIWIGPSEAEAIAMKLQDVSVPRPLTHDLLRSVIYGLGAAIRHILVSDLHDDTFFAKLILDNDGKTLEVDSRPSDAIALAVRARVPIFVNEAVLDKAGVLLDKETGKVTTPEVGHQEGNREVKEEDIKRMSAFKDLIESLDIDDLGADKGKELEG
ncbi:MAG: bifunctional nuclease family protein [Chloroflexi bacterium]|nr:bifunctional nuclease family protein [Chloroflexota bacterium]